MNLESKNLSAASDTNGVMAELERTMIASIALMKRLRREKRRSTRFERDAAQQGE